MNQKDKVSAIVSVILTAVIALLAVFGYDVVVVQPQIAGMGSGAAGTFIRAESGVEVTVDGAGPAVITVGPAVEPGQ